MTSTIIGMGFGVMTSKLPAQVEPCDAVMMKHCSSSGSSVTYCKNRYEKQQQDVISEVQKATTRVSRSYRI